MFSPDHTAELENDSMRIYRSFPSMRELQLLYPDKVRHYSRPKHTAGDARPANEQIVRTHSETSSVPLPTRPQQDVLARSASKPGSERPRSHGDPPSRTPNRPQQGVVARSESTPARRGNLEGKTTYAS